MNKFGFRIKTRAGMIVENLAIAAHDRAQAEQKLTQIYHHCEILECHEILPPLKEDGMSFENVISMISRESDPESPAKN